MKNPDNAVSPVTGVIVMIVAIIAISAIVASFALSLVPHPNQNQNAAVSVFQTDPNTITVTFLGTTDQTALTFIEISKIPTRGPQETRIMEPPAGSSFVPGFFMNITSSSGNGDKIKAIAHFKDRFTKTIFLGSPTAV